MKRYLLRVTWPQQPTPSFLVGAIVLLLLCHCSAYLPAEEIFIDCGSSDSSIASQSLWIGEDGPNNYLLDQEKSLKSTADIQHFDVDKEPYATARISRYKFSYSFQVTGGPKFVRLHFYPSNYDQNFSRSDTLFSVTSGRFTLLQNFSASLTADYLNSPSFSREFCIVVEDNQSLNLTFAASPYSLNAYALINGIEIVSMPPDLYYGNGTADGSRDLEFVGNDENPFTLSFIHALETVHRINIGGSLIVPRHDGTDLLRYWIGPDDPYLTEDISSVLPVNPTITLVFEKIPNYTAPGDVYSVARSMGTSRKINTAYNLTWSFPVDSNFTYIVRLHFCEFQREITKTGDRVFEIYVNSQVADLTADVIRWAGGSGIPIYRDYAVGIHAPTAKKMNLTVALHPAPESESVYADALLNGVEVFKVSGDDGNLAGPNPDRFQVFPPEIGPPSKSANAVLKRKVALTVGAGAFTILVLSLLCFLFFRQARGTNPSSDNNGLCLSTTARRSSLPSDLCHRFSLAEIKAATNDFDEAFIIGVGGFGNVYRGHMYSGSVQVAMKRLKPGSQQGAQEFLTEIEMLSRLRHRHLVSLIGCCHEEEEMILVYDYMSNGTLRDHLYNTKNPPLSWKQRLEICVGAARGLQYLHMGTKHMIIHRDIKTTNILLDEKWAAKVSDFGLSKMRTDDQSKSHISTIVKGTFGYLDPEYFRFHQLTEKSDVYSFGVVLLEVLCARPPVDTALDTEQISLALWVQSCYQGGTLDQIIDPIVKNEVIPECLEKFVETAVSCLQERGMQRPPMNDIVRSLELALQLQLQETQAPAPTTTMDGMMLDDVETEFSSDTESIHEVSVS